MSASITSGETDEPRVTVIIPAWGIYVALAAEAIESVGAQSAPARIIVVDNASQPPITSLDGCDLARSEIRLSRGEARNLGLSLVTTEYVMFLDADDVLLSGALARLLSGLDGHPGSPALVGGILEPSGARHRTPRRLAAVLARRPRLFAWVNAVWSLMPTQGAAIMRTATVREVGGCADASHGEDWALGASLAFRGEIIFDPDPVLIYRSRSDSPGAGRTPPRVMLESAGRIRARLRDDPAVDAGRFAIAALTIAQGLAVIAQPFARSARQLVTDLRRGARGPTGETRRSGR